MYVEFDQFISTNSCSDNCLFFWLITDFFSGCHIFSAESNHASLIQGVRASRVPKHIFRHNDAAHLEVLLQKVDISTPKIVVLETVMSMTGRFNCSFDFTLCCTQYTSPVWEKHGRKVAQDVAE